MYLELISFPLCPFVQSSIITLLHKEVPFRLTQIDLNNKPDWFLAISPMGKVPCLRVDSDVVIFESSVINEFIDEITPPSMHPRDPVGKARHRAWIEFASSALVDQFQMISAQGEERFAAASRMLFDKLEHLERTSGDGPFFAGDRLSLVDTAFAPLFVRMEIIHAIRPLTRWEGFARLRRWAAALLALPEVAASVTADFPERLQAYLAERGSLLLRSA